MFKKNLYLILTISVIMLFLIGQNVSAISLDKSMTKNSESSTMQYILFIGKVTSSDGNPIGEVTIEVTEDVPKDPRTFKGKTSSIGENKGTFAIFFQFPRGDCDTYFVKASKVGWKTQTKEVHVDSIPDIVNVDFTIVKKARTFDVHKILNDIFARFFFFKLINFQHL